MSELVDKYSAKQAIANIIGEEYIIPTYAVYNSVNDIDWQTLPESFVLKCTHDSGSAIICNNKKHFDFRNAEESLRNHLKINYYAQNLEWPYKTVRPRIICEKNICTNGEDLKDYKWFCFNGEPKIILIASNRNSNEETKTDFFDMDFNHLPFRSGHNNSDAPVEKPVLFDKMKEIAKTVSSGYPHMRVDLYEVNGNIYFGEVTFFHWGGFVPFEPIEWDYRIGNMLTLPDKQKCKETI